MEIPRNISTPTLHLYASEGLSSNPPSGVKEYPQNALRSVGFFLALRAGFEPATNRLTADCSTTELPENDVRKCITVLEKINS